MSFAILDCVECSVFIVFLFNLFFFYALLGYDGLVLIGSLHFVFIVNLIILLCRLA